MEFPFNINNFFPNHIVKLGSNDLMKRCDPSVKVVLDALGEASRKAQNLRRSVTTATSFINSEHNLYLLIDSKQNNGCGAVLGMLKTGTKKLFLLNRQGVQNELNPLCILDFYVHESCQRMGLGKILFDYFLQDENFNISQIVIDRPSDKFLGFLHKHYKLHDIIPQVNNFVIYEGFFGQEDSLKFPNSNQNQKFLPNRWNSMINVNAAADASPFRARGNQSSISCLYGQPQCHKAPNSDLWRTNSFVDVTRSTLPSTVHAEPKPFEPETASKFNHHRLW